MGELITNDKYPQWMPAVRQLDLQQLGGAAIDSYSHIDAWWARKVYYWSGITHDSQPGRLVSSISLLLVGQDEYVELCQGKKVEQTLYGYDWQRGGAAYLYWATLIIGQKQHAPRLFRSVTKALVDTLRNEGEGKLEISHTFTVTASRMSRALMLRHHNFAEVGQYRGRYPIVAKAIKDIPVLNAFLQVRE